MNLTFTSLRQSSALSPFERDSVQINEPKKTDETEDRRSNSELMEQVSRQLLLNRLGIDAEKLEELEKRIEELENKDQLTDKEREQLDNLYAAKEQLFEEAARRMNGEKLPPGSIVETVV